MEAQPRSKNGHPPQSTTGVAKASSIHPNNPPVIRCCRGWPGKTSETMTASSGSVNTGPDPQATRHAGQFWIGRVGGYRAGLKCHAANRARARRAAHDLRMHGAGVSDVLRCGVRGSIGFKRHTAFRASPWLCREHLRMHGAGVLRRWRGSWGQEPMDTKGAACEPSYFPGSIFELCPATLGTEVPGAVCVVERRLRSFPGR